MDRDSPNLEGNQLHTRQVERLDELTKTDEPTPKRLKISQGFPSALIFSPVSLASQSCSALFHPGRLWFESRSLAVTYLCLLCFFCSTPAGCGLNHVVSLLPTYVSCVSSVPPRQVVESDITHTNGDTNQTVREVPSKETDARLGTNNDVIDDDSLLSLNPKMLEAASETCSDLNVGDPLLNLSPELLAQLKIASEKQKALDVKHQARKRLAQATLRTNEMKAGLVREQHRLIMAELQVQ
uniref:Uncharacterized protein n=1 Tax=Timema douglasi TaxID=61478 RepID=A0A7R8W0B4_TIMDO|nr:unnamed protein product [Timema douglasi]